MTINMSGFLEERKALWLKDRLKKAQSETEIMELNQQANDKFSLEEWLPDAAKRVAQLSMVSHPSKFSHPSAKTSSVIANATYKLDGYLRSGNVNYPLDVFGNAAAMDVFKFLSITLSNGETILNNLENESELIQSAFSIPASNFADLRRAFLVIKSSENNAKTDRLVKQVYFPTTPKQYHLLSLLTPSGLLTELKQRIDKMRFSETTKEAKESRKKNQYHEFGYADIFDLTVTAYGGTQPQNVSVLNSKNAGRAYLLSSAPPQLDQRKIRLPKTDFFAQCLYRKQFQSSFLQLHKLMLLEINNIDIRNAIQNIIRYIIDQILFNAYCIRQHSIGWSNTDYYLSLPLVQRIWLDDVHEVERIENDDWRDEISREISRWILRSYEKVIQGTSVLGVGELMNTRTEVEDLLKQDKEFF